MKRGILFVISAPSGTGKTTVIKEIRELFPELSYSISFTTRPPRRNEVHGKDYFFVSREQFEEMIKASKFLEWEEIHGNLYGTSKELIQKELGSGKDVILDIDVKGAKNVAKQFEDVVLIFLMPPSIEILEQRLRNRQTEGEEVIRKRLETAKEELKERDKFHYQVTNDVLADAVKEISEIIRKERANRRG